MFPKHPLLVVLFGLLLSCNSASESNSELSEHTLKVGFVIVDGVFNTELTAPIDIFHHTKFRTDTGYMQVFMVAPTANAVTSFEGQRYIPDYTFENCPDIDVLVVPSAEHSTDSDLDNDALMSFVKARGATAQYVMSLCDGAFVLAGAGFLDGVECTTFPADIDQLQTDFPKTITHKGVSFVHDGKYITSNGGARSFDAALYLVELIYGRQAAVETAEGMCIDWELKELDYLVF